MRTVVLAIRRSRCPAAVTLPARAGIDPYNKLIDRRPKDNTVAVELG